MILIPDILTTIRLVLVPFIFLSISKNEILTIILLIIAFITDIFDGIISRKLKIQNREFGKAYDHLVDKLLVFVIVYGLVIYKNLPNWALLFFLIREFILIIGAVFLWFNKKKIEGSNVFGKIAGFFFYFMVISYLLNFEFKFLSLIFSILSSILAFLIYVLRAIYFSHFQS
ncbi:MAG: CDP-alcohol phosphatidyltransferase family protein [Candidatus Hydrothermia bacterium]|nr:CDP-alcohol phosphatidyltransferase family protein [Candidatus Hydrothermia bacterium]